MGSITVTDLGKAYKNYPTRWSRFIEWLDHTGKVRHEQHWVLKGINFKIRPGEAVGIIGVNGAGKSTLLKMITGTTQPTTGSVEVNGRVAALLELGMGFHPDFTGRQNVVMAGQLLGMQLHEISSLIPEIEGFAGIGSYIDQPVRIYSSGMQVRLAFAVATCMRPDILIIDEALAVGDAAFQRKCFKRIEAYRAAGTTLLFVSHDIETIKKICDRALLIKSGALALSGPAKQVCDEYERYLFGNSQSGIVIKNSPPSVVVKTAYYDHNLISSCENIYGNGDAEIEECWLADLDSSRINIVQSGIPFRWCYRVRFNKEVENPIFAMMLKTREGITLFGVDSKGMDAHNISALKSETYYVEFTLQNPLAPGIYYLNCGVRLDTLEGSQFLCRRVDTAILRVTPCQETTVLSGLLEMRSELLLKNIDCEVHSE